MRALAMLLLTGLIAACASDPVPPDRYYRLAATPTAAVAGWKLRIAVQPFEVHGVYSERALLFRREAAGGKAVEQYNYHFWAEPPALIFGDLVTDHLRSVFGERQVYRAASRVRPDLVVRPRLRNIEQVLDPAPAAHLALQFVVTDDVNTPLLVVDFDQTEKLAGDGPDAYVAAINRLADRAATQLSTEMAGVDLDR